MLWILFLYNIYTAAMSTVNGLLKDYVNCAIFCMLTVLGIASQFSYYNLSKAFLVFYIGSTAAGLCMSGLHLTSLNDATQSHYRFVVEKKLIGYEDQIVKDYIWWGLLGGSIGAMTASTITSILLSCYIVRHSKKVKKIRDKQYRN
eukprot:NODE_328_length_10919_cov_0.472828.p5 type:complete len:146 gc:universal NODE_328_length_10919_cov_0.472828:7893-8330(+)